MATKRKHVEVTLKIKYKALQKLGKGQSATDVAAKFNLPVK